MNHDDCPICRSLLLQYDDDDDTDDTSSEATIPNSQVPPSTYSNPIATIGTVADDFDIESQSPSRNEGGGGEQMNDDDADDHRSEPGTATVRNTLLSIVLRRGHRSGGVPSSYSHDRLGRRDIPRGERTPPRQVEEGGVQEDVDDVEMGSWESAHECEVVGSSSSSSSDGNGERMIGLGGGDGSTIGDHDGSGRNPGRQKRKRDSKRYHSLNP